MRPNTHLVNELLDALRAAAHLGDVTAAPAWLEEAIGPPAEEIVACANGLLHLPTLELLPHTPAFFTHNALDYAFERNAPAPAKWLAFLRQLWPDDAQTIEALQDFFGYCLTADTSQQKAFLLVGPKRSGKGTIARVLTRLISAANAVAPTLASLGITFGLEPLIGKQVAIVSGALASRFIVLVLTESFYGKEDPDLTGKLLPELPGILNWAIEGWRRLRERGYFVQPKSAEDIIEDLKALGSPITAFLRDCCEVGPGLSESVDEMFFAWSGWCLDQGRKEYQTGNKQSFGRDLRAAVPGVKTKQPRDGGGRVRIYEGVRVKRTAVSPEEVEPRLPDY